MAGTFFIVVDCVVVVVVAGTGFSTTVVQEARIAASASSGVRMISFFIVGWSCSKLNSTQLTSADVFQVKIFTNFSATLSETAKLASHFEVRSVIDARPELL